MQLLDGHVPCGAIFAQLVRLTRRHARERLQGSRCLVYRPHLDPMTKRHDVDQRCQLPDERHAPERTYSDECAVQECRRDCHSDERHHARRTAASVVDETLQEGPTAVEVHDRRQEEDYEVASRELDLRQGRRTGAGPPMSWRESGPSRQATARSAGEDPQLNGPRDGRCRRGRHRAARPTPSHHRPSGRAADSVPGALVRELPPAWRKPTRRSAFSLIRVRSPGFAEQDSPGSLTNTRTLVSWCPRFSAGPASARRTALW